MGAHSKGFGIGNAARIECVLDKMFVHVYFLFFNLKMNIQSYPTENEQTAEIEVSLKFKTECIVWTCNQI